VNTEAEFFDALLEEQVEPIPVRLIKKDGLSGVTTKNDVIDGAWEMYAGFTWHGIRIAINV
jgi:hypothetical protein